MFRQHQSLPKEDTMRISVTMAAAMLAAAVPELVWATDDQHEDMSAEMMAEHGGGVFHMFRLELDAGTANGDTASSWDLDGWVGTDEDKLWIKSEGEVEKGGTEEAEVWALYSRNISTFWDVQGGIRYDFEPEPTAYLAVGFEGLAPYFFETGAHLFISDKGNLSARIRRENDLLITQRFVLQHYAEANLYLQDAIESETGSGLGEAEIGLQGRYEFTRKFAPYVDIRYGRKFGETSRIAESNGEDSGQLTTSVGVRLMF